MINNVITMHVIQKTVAFISLMILLMILEHSITTLQDFIVSKTNKKKLDENLSSVKEY